MHRHWVIVTVAGLVAGTAHGGRESEDERAGLEQEQARLKQTLEEELKTLQIMLGKIEAAEHELPQSSEPVSPRSAPRRRLSHIAGTVVCAKADTPSFPFAANSGWSTPAVERVFSQVTVSGGLYASGVSWSLVCDGDFSITGGAKYSTEHAIQANSTCTLSMTSETLTAAGDRWSGSRWSAPGWNASFTLSSGPSFTPRPSFNQSFTVPPTATRQNAEEPFQYWMGSTPSAGTGPSKGPNGPDGASGPSLGYPYYYTEVGTNLTFAHKIFTLGFDGAVQCGGSVVASVYFQYHMYGSEIGTLSLKTAKGTTVWSKSGEQEGSTLGSPNYGWISSGKVSVNSASFYFEYAGATGRKGDAAVAQVQVCCPQPKQPITILVDDHGVPHSFDDAAACLHSEESEQFGAPPLTIREDLTSTLQHPLTLLLHPLTTGSGDSNAAALSQPSNRRVLRLTDRAVRCGSRGFHL